MMGMKFFTVSDSLTFLNNASNVLASDNLSLRMEKYYKDYSSVE